jgi:hypothetical protein
MDRDTWRRVSDVFADYVECAELERPGFLARLEATDANIAQEVRALAKVHAQDEDFLETPGVYQETESCGVSDSGAGKIGWLAPELRAERPHGSRSRSLAFWLFLTANFGVFGCFGFALWVIGQHRSVSVDPGWQADPTTNGWLVTEVDKPGPAAGILLVGDYVLEVNHDPIWLPELLNVRAGRAYSMRVDRKAQALDLSLVNQELRNRRWFGGIFCCLLVSLTYFVTAVVVSIMQPRPRITRLAWASLSGEAVTLLCMLMRPYETFLTGLGYALFSIMQVVDGPHLAFSFHFFWRVFGGPQSSRRSLVLVWLLYVWAIVGALYRAFLVTRFTIGPLTFFFWSHLKAWQALNAMEGAFYLVAPLSICLAVAWSYLRARDEDERRRAGLIALGSLAGILPYLVLRWAAAIGLTQADYGGVYGILPAALIPIAVAYAILKHHLFDIHVVVRRGLQYLVARNVLRFILALPAVALAYSLVTNANRTVGEAILHNSIFITLTVLIALVLRFRERLSSWLDRRFFREIYPQERILLNLIDSLLTVGAAPEMGRRVVEELTQALHPESVYFFYFAAENKAYLAGFATDTRADGICIPEGTALPTFLAKSERPVQVQALPTVGVPPMSWTWLRTLGTDLIVPLHRAGGTTAGFLLLGSKKSEQPYSPRDHNLLLGLARQMALVYENLLLQDQLLQQQRTNERMRARVEGAGTNWLQECLQCGRCFDYSVRTCSEDGIELVLSLPVQRVIDGRYRLDQVVGRGGMGTVFAARDLRLDRQVAVKLVQAGRISESAWLRRFSREARALSRLQHENVVLTYDFGVVEEEAAYLIMEFVSGSTLRTEIDSGELPAATAASWFHQLLEGVKAAHAAGIVHRDLKPENVLIARCEAGPRRVKIADFGVAKWLKPDPESVSLTLPGTIVGSLNYMSPEQLAGQPVDTRSDIFSIGVMAFEVLTGRVPFGGATYPERVASFLPDAEHFWTRLQDAPDLRITLRKCLAKDPAERFESVEALRDELIPRMRQCRTNLRRTAESA